MVRPALLVRIAFVNLLASAYVSIRQHTSAYVSIPALRMHIAFVILLATCEESENESESESEIEREREGDKGAREDR